MTPATRIRLCRRLEVEWEGERLEAALPGNQGRLLFAYLVLHRERTVRRDELLEVLWSGESAPQSADAVLSAPLSRLRKALGPGRLNGRGELSLALPPATWVDWEAAFIGVREAHAAVAAERWPDAWIARERGAGDRRRRAAAGPRGALDRREAQPSSRTCGSSCWK